MKNTKTLISAPNLTCDNFILLMMYHFQKRNVSCLNFTPCVWLEVKVVVDTRNNIQTNLKKN